MANEKHPPDTLKALLEASFARYADRPAFASMGVTLSYRAEALAGHCAKYLAPYKRPKRIEFRDSLPKSPLGKVLHRELRAAATMPGAHRAASR